MIPKEDVYADKDGKITNAPEKYARQIAVAGVFLDDRIAKRYGIMDTLVSTDEPNAPRRVKGGASVQISSPDDEEKEKAEVEPETDEPETTVKKKGAKKK